MPVPRTSRSRNTLLLYVDIVVLGVAALALVGVVHNAYYSGFWASELPRAAASRTTWMYANLAILAVTLSWFLGRFYRARVKELVHAY